MIRGREVTVHVPGLLGPWPRALAGDVVRGLDLPGLVGLLARSRRAGGRARSGGDPPFASFERLAFSAFGYSRGADDVPAAALMRERDAAAARGRPPPGKGSGTDAGTGTGTGTGEGPPRAGTAAAGGGRGEDGPDRVPPASLRADPVHLRPDLDAARLFDPTSFSLSAEEAAALAGALDRHFAPEGIRFEALRPDRWYVRLPEHPDAVFQPPGAAAGRGAGELLPGGPEGSRWRRRMNEAQMVLHGHPCNEARETRGELPVNSVWFWGAGALEDAPRPRFEEVHADDDLVRALAERGGARVRVRGLEGGAGAEGTPPGAVLVAPGDDLYRAVAGRDVERWRRELLRTEERWFGPLHAGMRSGAVRRVVIDAGLRPGEAVLEAPPRRWRRPFAGASAPAPASGLADFLLDEGGGG